jgi:tetratricopeptide (TPR) repeat protein
MIAFSPGNSHFKNLPVLQAGPISWLFIFCICFHTAAGQSKASDYPNSGSDTSISGLFWKAFSEAKFDNAMEYGEQYRIIAEKNKDPESIFMSLTNMFALYRQTGNYEKSFEYAQQLYDIAINNGNRKWIAASLWALGELYVSVEDYSGALNYYRRTLEICDSNLTELQIYPDARIRFRTQYAELFSLMNQFDSAHYYYELYKPTDIRNRRYYLAGMGNYYYLKGNYQEALRNFLPALPEERIQPDVNAEMQTLLNIANCYLLLDSSANALLYGRQGLDLALKSGVNQYVRDGNKILSDVYGRIEMTDSSNFYFRKFSIVKDAVLNSQTRGRFAAYNYEQRLSAMNTDREIQVIKLQKETLMKNILIGGMIVLLLFAFLFSRNIILRRRWEGRRRELAENELLIQKLESEKSHAELLQQQRDLEMKALRAQMNPHFIFNCLNSINRFIIKNEAEQAADYLTKFAKLIRVVLEKSGKAFIPLGEEIDCLKLYMDLEALRFEIPFTYEINCAGIPMESVQVPSLLMQPFVENAIWHGLNPVQKANGHIKINLWIENEILHADIFDNGIGIADSAALKIHEAGENKSMGIELTRNRLRLADTLHAGNLGVSFEPLKDASGKNTGTCVHIKIPVLFD